MGFAGLAGSDRMLKDEAGFETRDRAGDGPGF